MILDTYDESTAVDTIVLPLLTRHVEIDWRSGSTSGHLVRRRDQLRLIWSHFTDLDLSYGQWANWIKWDYQDQF